MLTGLGMNVDGSHAGGRADPALLKLLGVDWVRMVAYLTPEVRTYVVDCEEQGLDVLLVIARESVEDSDGTWTIGDQWYHDIFPTVQYWQIGNEPDLESDSSWTLSPNEYALLWTACASFAKDKTLILGGLASGNPQWLVDTLPLLQRKPDAITLHPYGQRPLPDWPAPDWGFGYVGDLLDAYRRVAGGIPLLVSEFGCNVDEVGEDLQATYLPEMATTLLGQGVPCALYAWSDAMNPQFGLIRPDGTTRPSFAALEGIAMPKEAYVIGPGFQDRIKELQLTALGPEEYFSPNYSIVLTDKGPLWYSKPENKVIGPFDDGA